MKDFADTQPIGLYEAAIGARNQNYYIDKFESFDEKGPGLHGSWNWSAFLFTGSWALYRRMFFSYLVWSVGLLAAGAALAFALSFVLAIYGYEPLPQFVRLYVPLFAISVSWLGCSVIANSLYHRRVKASILTARKWDLDRALLDSRLTLAGSVREWVPRAAIGFTALLVILAVVTLYGFPGYVERMKTALTSPDCFWCRNKIAPPAKAVTKLPAISTSQSTTEGKLSLAQVARGRGDYFTAVEIYRELANAGNALAQNNLGVMYSTGEGVDRNYPEAVRWYGMSASQGLADAQFNLATKYDQGLGVDQNYPEAFKWYLLAATQGNAYAQGNVGAMYAEGQGVAQNYAEAIKWYRLATLQGNATAQHGLGGMYFSGQGVARDYIRAYMWFNLAAASGGQNSAIVRDKVARLLTPHEIDQAQQMARDCQQQRFQGCDDAE